MSSVDYAVVFDGGSKGNPGPGYGSYRVRESGGEWLPPVRLDFGDRVTNNEAEYRALIAALEDVAERCREPSRASVEALGDSKLVLCHLKGEWKVRAANLRPLFNEAKAAARRFRSVRYTWHRRDKSVALLGH
jgi:ribonuclease HI